LSEPFPHTAKADSGAARYDQIVLFLLGDTLAVVENLNNQAAIPLPDAYRRGGTAGMTVNIGEAFLNDSEDGEFRLAWEPIEIRRDLQFHFDFAALGKAIDEPAKRGGQTSHLKQRGMKQVSDRANFPEGLFYELNIFRDGSGTGRIELVGLSLHHADVYIESGEDLADAVV
jgi:hypothetical protein